ALPLMAIGFVKKDGMQFEKYFALLIRHKTGRNEYHYKPELLIDYLNKDERKSKYAWITGKETEETAGAKPTKKEQKANARKKECEVFKITKKIRKTKSKETRRKIKEAKQEYRTTKRRYKKAAKERSRTEKLTANS
ncbi:MAG TPA: PrgI family protein, partial [Treponemataceae bacterium]|nr:PrgI family protein [Treponemataceae bacterium]